MLINNPFQMNDWKFGQFIKLVIIIQFLILLIAGLNLNGTVILFVNQLIGFIYLTFIPGYLILRILKIHEIGSVKSILYAVGLSLSSVMFIGFTVNMVLPEFGISRTISLIPLTVVFSAYVIILSILSYIRDKDFNSPSLIDTNDLFSKVFLFLALIPFLAIFGSYSMNFNGNNILSMLLIAVIGLLLLLVIFDKIPEKWHLFTIWITAISLLYFSSLISPLVWGWDIQNEYYLANLVLNYSHWNYMLPDAYNAMLSIVIIAPIYSILTSINLDYIFKIIYPFFFSLIPLGLYKIFKTQTNSSKIAFLAVFLFMSFNTFYIELVTLAREMTAELFLVLLLLIIFDRKFKPNIMILMLVFSMGLVVSHYSLTYFFIVALAGVTIMLALYNISKFNKSLEKLYFKGNQTIIYVLTFITTIMILFAYLWYGFFSKGLALNAIVDVLTVFLRDIFQKFNYIIKRELVLDISTYAFLVVLSVIIILSIIYLLKFRQNRHQTKRYTWMNSIPKSIKGKINYKILAILSIIVLVALTFLTGPPKTWIVTVLRYLNFTVVFFTFTGMAIIFLNFYKNKFQEEYLAFSVVVAVMLISGLIIPSFEVSFNITRIYEIAFIILSPFSVIGGMKILGSIYGILNRKKIDFGKPLKIFSLFILIFMLFNTGFISVLAGQSIPMHLSGESNASDYYPRFNYQESLGAQWLSKNKVSSSIYADVYGRLIFYRYILNLNEIASNNGVSDFTAYNDSNSYIYSRKLNDNNSFLTGFTSRNDRKRVYFDLSSIVQPKNRIFDDGDSRIYYS